jgi:hypothetical protein
VLGDGGAGQGGLCQRALSWQPQWQGWVQWSLRGEDPAPTTRPRSTARGASAPLRLADESLLLKPTTDAADEAGARLKKGSREYEILRAGIAARAPDDASALKLARLEVTPRDDYYYAPKTNAEIQAMAVFADGQRRDVTTLAVYEVSMSPSPRSRPWPRLCASARRRRPALVRYLDQQAPCGWLCADLVQRRVHNPKPANAVDEQVYAKLKQSPRYPRRHLHRRGVLCSR